MIRHDGDRTDGNGWDLSTPDDEAAILGQLAGLSQALAAALRPVPVPAQFRADLRREILRASAALPEPISLTESLTEQALDLGRRSMRLLGRPRARLALGATTAVAAVGLALLRQRRLHRHTFKPALGLG